MQIFIKINGEQSGPFTEVVVIRKIKAGEVSPHDLAWHEKADGWKPLNTIPAILDLMPPQPPPPPQAQSGPVMSTNTIVNVRQDSGCWTGCAIVCAVLGLTAILFMGGCGACMSRLNYRKAPPPAPAVTEPLSPTPSNP